MWDRTVDGEDEAHTWEEAQGGGRRRHQGAHVFCRTRVFCRAPANRNAQVASAYFYTVKLAPRLRLWMSNKQRAETLNAYRAYAETAPKMGSFFGSLLYKQLRAKGLFRGHQDLAMFLTTDAVKVFKSRQEFKCQPIATVGDPHSRTQRRRARRSPS